MPCIQVDFRVVNRVKVKPIFLCLYPHLCVTTHQVRKLPGVEYSGEEQLRRLEALRKQLALKKRLLLKYKTKSEAPH